MIGKLKGVVDGFGEDHVVVDVGGVGYVVHCSARTLQRLPRAGEAATLVIETMVREDMIRLYGFGSDAEREWFRLLTTVQGVGAKVALGVLSVLDPGALATAIAMRDLTAIARAPGVGKRLAERLATELKDKAPAFADADPAVLRTAEEVRESRAAGPVAEAISALVNLGYAQLQATAAVTAAAKAAGEDAGTAVLIRAGLKELSK
ncbi:Holliday junction branch migration protein RuvA [Oharaeibacter diazotrophicus]|uniref:Holliday junction branch migration complex subunit RuvA n=1 Tax=Oharaeibacter diazotrophicus TaxID=1920512 RepID=A0A4R6RFE1_9HYPH|nr:Holliday junction branch migration protein RuvA [Oharaeibacter diazotrophicus]TDP85101.1 Holliday junction DNA helicase subunit RuvA [Oharaeibacter diazotrophicus]BBE74071.1 holliday junction ATP-dependent DNA helicase RuvA [Pleomorphomonas sp. SM30]GLS76241.1 Holliday junction ATP-dependent DNA helicase RuvA [Oharaeibacter diazotrophicus]